MSTRIISISELRDELPAVAKEVSGTKNRRIVTVHGKPRLMVVDFADWSDMAEHFLSPREMRAVNEAEKDIKAGRTVSLESLLEELEANEG